MNAETLYNIRPDKFIELAEQTNSYGEFIQYLRNTGTFGVIDIISESERKKLYMLALAGLAKKKN